MFVVGGQFTCLHIVPNENLLNVGGLNGEPFSITVNCKSLVTGVKNTNNICVFCILSYVVI